MVILHHVAFCVFRNCNDVRGILHSDAVQCVNLPCIAFSEKAGNLSTPNP